VRTVYANRKINAATKVVAHVVSLYINRQGLNAWPSTREIAKVAGLSRMTTQRAIGKLEAIGYLEVGTKPMGRPNFQPVNCYRLLLPSMDAEGAPVVQSVDHSIPAMDVAVVQCGAGSGLILRRQWSNPEQAVVYPGRPEPLKEPLKEPLSEPLRVARARPTPDASLSAKAGDKPRRAERLAPDWQLTDVDRLYASGHGYQPRDIDIQAEKFRNYWISKAGKDAAKLDWPATWRNWILNDLERRGGTRSSPVPRVPRV
jgi:hypothetical protein